jgi:hypothetical protein
MRQNSTNAKRRQVSVSLYDYSNIGKSLWFVYPPKTECFTLE